MSAEQPRFVIPGYQNFIFATTAPQLAVLFTNPFDTVKVRLQLQAKQNIYKNSGDALIKIFQNEGLSGLQKGLTPAIFREGTKNIFRIGLFQPIMDVIHPKEKYDYSAPVWKRLVGGATSGAIGALSCNPFELIKTRMQAASAGKLVVGHQYQYTGLVNAFSSIIKNEGVGALYKGSSMSVIRAMIASGSNLAFYSSIREYILLNNIMADNSFTDASVSLVSSAFTAVAMNPVDMVRTRIYNQPIDPITQKGTLYKNGIDALFKIVKTEGVLALYKGTLSSFMRLGPHFTLTFVFLEQMKRLAMLNQKSKYEKNQKLELETLFSKYDLDHNNSLDRNEIQAMLRELIPRNDESYLSDDQYSLLLKKDVDKLIKIADKNKDGLIQQDEFAKLVDESKRVIREHELEAAFMYFDRDGNGLIDKADMVYALKNLFPRTGKDLKISEDQYEIQLEKDVDKILYLVDTDHNGTIEFDEFVKVANKLPKLQVKRLMQTMMTEAGIATVY